MFTPRSTSLETRAFWVLVPLVAGSAFVVLYLPFVLGQKNFFHDSLTAGTLIAAFYDRLFSGDSWLWSALLNGGHPLWVSLEVVPLFDPVVVVVYSAAAALGSGWMTPYYVSVFVWLFVFALGGYLCANLQTNNRWSALLAFVLLFSGPFALSIPAQSSGFLLPFRYFPLAVYFYLRLRHRVTFKHVLCLTTVLAFSLAGYQSVYPFIALLSLAFAELLVGSRSYLSWLRQLCAPRYVWLFAIPLLVLAPTIVWFDYTRWLVAIPREFGHRLAYFYSLEDFVRGLFLTYFDLLYPEFRPSPSQWNYGALAMYHGTSNLGFLAIPFLLLGLRRSVMEGIRPARTGAVDFPQQRHSAVLVIWLILIVALACGVLGMREYTQSEGAVLDVRNFGFLLVTAVFLLSLMVARGFGEIMEGRYGSADIAIDSAIFAACALTADWYLGHQVMSLWVTAALTGVFISVASILWYLRARFRPTQFAIPVVVAVFTESLLFGSSFMPSWETVARSLQKEEVITLARDRVPNFRAARERLPNSRSFEFPVALYWPFHLEGPAVRRIATAYSQPIYDSSPFGKTGLIEWTHLFRLRGYNALVTESIGSARVKEILGVTRPILEIVPASALEDTAHGLRLVTEEGAKTCYGPGIALGDSKTCSKCSSCSAGKILEVAYEGDRVGIMLRATQQAVLVYRDNFAPGWSVTIDGRQAELLIVDKVNKAVTVLTGQHRVEFIYRPWLYLVAFALRFVVMLVAGAACASLVLKHLNRARNVA